MRRHIILLIVLFLAPASAVAAEAEKIPDWAVRGFEAALADKGEGVVAGALVLGSDIAGAIPPGARADAAIDRIRPLWNSTNPDVIEAAVDAVSHIPTSDRADVIVNKLILLLSNQSSRVRCLVPAFDGASCDQEWKDALWARFFMGAPARQRQSVERYSIVKRA